MNYFEFYNLPTSFSLDESLLKAKYYELSRKFHPDLYATETDETRRHVLEQSTLNNAAYKTLKDFNRRTHYILDLNGLVTEGEKHPLPPDFLAEMMDVNELLMELEMEPDAAKLAEAEKQVKAWETQLNDELHRLGAAYDVAAETDKPSLLQQVRETYHKTKYILRLNDSLSKFATL